MKRARLAAVIAGAGAVVGILASAMPAYATATPDRPVYGTYYYVVNSSYVGNHVDYSHVVARCYSTGGTCTISSGHSATTSIDVSLGWTRSGVAAGLGISASSTVGLTVSCTSPVLASGTAWTAYAIGRYYSYQIEKMVSQPSGTTYTYSGTLHAFSAYSNQMYCS